MNKILKKMYERFAFNALNIQDYQKSSDRLENKQWQEGRVLFWQALEYDKDNPLIYNNLGIISLNHEKEYLKAKTYFQKALVYYNLTIIKRNPDKAEFHIQKETGNIKEALNFLSRKKARRKHGSNKRYHGNLFQGS
jgi:tetratricopeptide (TPR) repeat protein